MGGCCSEGGEGWVGDCVVVREWEGWVGDCVVVREGRVGWVSVL